MDSFYQQAYGLLRLDEGEEAFSLKGETDATKTLYGMIGQGLRSLPDRPAAPVPDRSPPGKPVPGSSPSPSAPGTPTPIITAASKPRCLTSTVASRA